MDPEAVKNLPGICIGKEMSHQLRAWVGDVVSVLTPLGEMTPTGPVPRSRPFRVACILYSGMYEYDSKFVYIGIPEAQKFFKMGDNVVGLELKFTDVDAARALGRRVVAALGGFPYRTKDWAELNRNLFSALKLEKLAMAIILTFIVLVACFNILHPQVDGRARRQRDEDLRGGGAHHRSHRNRNGAPLGARLLLVHREVRAAARP